MKRAVTTLRLLAFLACLALVGLARAEEERASRDLDVDGLVVEDLGKEHDRDPATLKKGLFHHLADPKRVSGGNTSVRNEAEASLVWKGSPSANGYGYFQRNRDLGQVFVVPGEEQVGVDALVLRTGKGDNAVMSGAPGAPVYLQFFRVEIPEESAFRINDNGTGPGERAKHGFDHRLHRVDDYIEGVRYEPIARFTGGLFPESIEPTTRHLDRRGKGTPHGEQPGHLRYFRLKLPTENPLKLKGGGRYAFMLGFEEPGENRGVGLANDPGPIRSNKAAAFVSDANAATVWAIRREGDGTLPPTMIEGPNPPEQPAERAALVAESLFAPRHWASLSPGSNGYPDVDTYRTLQFYLELRGE